MEAHEKISVMANALVQNNDDQGALLIYQKFIDENMSSALPNIQNSVNFIIKNKIELLEAIQENDEIDLNNAILLNYDLLFRRYLGSNNKEMAAQVGYDKGVYLLNRDFWEGINQLQTNFDNFKMNQSIEILTVAYECALRIYSDIDFYDDYFIKACVQLSEFCLSNDFKNMDTYHTCGEIADNLEQRGRFDLAQRIYKRRFTHPQTPLKERIYNIFCLALCHEEMNNYSKAIHGYQYCLINYDENDKLGWLGAIEGLGRCYDALDKSSHAISYYSEIIRRWSDDDEMIKYVAEAHQSIAFSYFTMARQCPDNICSSKYANLAYEEHQFVFSNYHKNPKLGELVLRSILGAFNLNQDLKHNEAGAQMIRVALGLIRENYTLDSSEMDQLRLFIS